MLFIVLVFCVVLFGGVHVVHLLSLLCCGFVFVCLVYPVLLVSLDCPFLVAPPVFSNVYIAFMPIIIKELISVTCSTIVLTY